MSIIKVKILSMNWVNKSSYIYMNHLSEKSTIKSHHFFKIFAKYVVLVYN